MKRAALAVLIALVAATAGWGQYQQFIFQAPPPSMVGGIQATVIGARANTTLYYWVTARYPIGVTMPAGPGRAVGGQAIAALSGVNYNRVSWGAVSGATGYDVIRTTIPQFPTNGTCLNCVVVANTAVTTFNDIGGAVVNWPTADTLPAPASKLSVVMNNRDDDYPFLTVGGEMHLMPTRRPTGSAGYAYLFEVGGLMTGTTAEKTYALGINVTRPVGSVATGDSNDALIRGSYSNYAANDGNFIMRGINTSISNRGGGTLGITEAANISSANQIKGTSPQLRGMMLSVENYGVVADQFSGLTVAMKNEAAKATLEYGVKVQNDNNSLATALDAAYMIRSSAGLANAGFEYGMDMNGSTIGTADVRTHIGNNIYSGNGAPAAGLCAAPTLGSVYLNLGGGAGTSLYVCEVAGAWAGK